MLCFLIEVLDQPRAPNFVVQFSACCSSLPIEVECPDRGDVYRAVYVAARCLFATLGGFKREQCRTFNKVRYFVSATGVRGHCKLISV